MKLVCRCKAYPFPHQPSCGRCTQSAGSPLVRPRGRGVRKPKPPGRPRTKPPAVLKRRGWLLYGLPKDGAAQDGEE